MTTLTENIKRIQLLRAEQDRLLNTLLYYEWLRGVGVDPETVVGVTQAIPLSPRVRNDLWKGHAVLFRVPVDKRPTRAISYKLQDGTEHLLPYPPFQADVIYNKTLLIDH